MEERTIRNAVITSATLSINDKGILDCWLFLDYGNGGQGFGGWALYLSEGFKHHNMNGPAGHFIYRVMKIAGVENWNDLPGKTIRAEQDYSKVYKIGHIINNDWFDPVEDFKKCGITD